MPSLSGVVNLEEIVSLLEEIAVLLELKGENVFKVKAYLNAAQVIENYLGSPSSLIEEISKKGLKGLGPNLAQLVLEIYQTGTSAELIALRSEFPSGILEILKVSGLGAKKVKALRDALSITTLEQLEQACREGEVAAIKGFGEKSQEKILAGTLKIKEWRGKLLISQASKIAEGILETLLAQDLIERIEIAGDLRSNCEIISTIDFVLIESNSGDLIRALEQVAGLGVTLEKSEQHVVAQHASGTLLRFYITFPSSFSAKLRELTKDEIDFDAQELVQAEDIKGILHLHTTWSDGAQGLKDMAVAARDSGYSYIGVTDHSQSAGYANGLSPARIIAQQREIEQLNRELAPFRILKGIESDILADGSLDYSNEVLASFDFVIASVHSGFSMKSEEMTERLVRAIRNPFTSILGHPTGRLLLRRDGYPMDMQKVLAAASESGTPIELNANPHRLDLDWRFHQQAKNLNIPIPICPDAHSVQGLTDLEWGIALAQKGQLSSGDVLNSKTCAELLEFFKDLRLKKSKVFQEVTEFP